MYQIFNICIFISLIPNENTIPDIKTFIHPMIRNNPTYDKYHFKKQCMAVLKSIHWRPVMIPYLLYVEYYIFEQFYKNT